MIMHDYKAGEGIKQSGKSDYIISDYIISEGSLILIPADTTYEKLSEKDWKSCFRTPTEIYFGIIEIIWINVLDFSELFSITSVYVCPLTKHPREKCLDARNTDEKFRIQEIPRRKNFGLMKYRQRHYSTEPLDPQNLAHFINNY